MPKQNLNFTMRDSKESSCQAGITRRGFLKGAVGISALSLLPLPGIVGCAPQEDNASSVEEGGVYDVIVVGSGGAGMTAALSAHEAGARVALLEKMTSIGGNTNFAEAGMNASETKLQKEEGIEDSNELFAEDTFVGGKELGNRKLIDFMCSHSNEAIERLAERGMPLTKISTTGGSSVPRVHRPKDGSAVGQYLVKHMNELCAQWGVEVQTMMDVKKLLMEEGRVAGVIASKNQKDYRFTAPAVILATGGFGANHEMLAQYRPELIDVVTTNQPGAQGDGIIMASEVGADTVDLEYIQVHPTVEQNTSILLSEAVRGDGAILVNAEGNRFVDELLTRDKVTAAEWEQAGGWAYAVFDQQVYNSNTSIKEKFESEGLLLQGNTFEELCAGMETMDEASFIATVTSYNNCIAQGIEDPYGRWESLYPLVEPPFYAIKVAPGIHHTMGGLKIDVNARVLSTEGEPIPGLFAAGEVTGGIHGGNRLGGNAVCDINVFGHRAAEQALAYLDSTVFV